MCENFSCITLSQKQDALLWITFVSFQNIYHVFMQLNFVQLNQHIDIAMSFVVNSLFSKIYHGKIIWSFWILNYVYYLLLLLFVTLHYTFGTTLTFFGSGLSPQSCLYSQGFRGSELLNGCVVVWPSNYISGNNI